MKVCVYCSSSSKIDKIYFEATEKLAKEFIEENIQVIYGGGGNGLMGHLADIIIDNGGKIKGISPKFMQDIEWTHKRLTDLEIVTTMHERKTKFLDNNLGGVDNEIKALEFLNQAMYNFEIYTVNRERMKINVTDKEFDRKSEIRDSILDKSRIKKEAENLISSN